MKCDLTHLSKIISTISDGVDDGSILKANINFEIDPDTQECSLVGSCSNEHDDVLIFKDDE